MANLSDLVGFALTVTTWLVIMWSFWPYPFGNFDLPFILSTISVQKFLICRSSVRIIFLSRLSVQKFQLAVHPFTVPLSNGLPNCSSPVRLLFRSVFERLALGTLSRERSQIPGGLNLFSDGLKEYFSNWIEWIVIIHRIHKWRPRGTTWFRMHENEAW